MRSRYLVFKYNPLLDKCPACCDYTKLHRSQIRTIKEYLFTSLSLHRLYRCGGCGWRGYLFTLIFSRKKVSDLFLYSGVAAVACFILMQVLRKL